MPKTAHILMLDDRASVLEILQDELSKGAGSNYHFVCVSNEAELIQQLEESKNFDLAIVDLLLDEDDEQRKTPSGLRISLDLVQHWEIPTILITLRPSFRFFREDYFSRPQRIPLNLWSKDEDIEDLRSLVAATIRGKAVFVVHGHDVNARVQVVEAIRAIGYYPIVLQNEPNKGRTIIQKLNDLSQAAYTVVVMTPDDLGGKAADTPELRARARENVIFELGLFLGKQDLRNVCILKTPGLDLPSDLHGIAWVALDLTNDDWRRSLYREMRATGLDINPG